MPKLHPLMDIEPSGPRINPSGKKPAQVEGGVPVLGWRVEDAPDLNKKEAGASREKLTEECQIYH